MKLIATIMLSLVISYSIAQNKGTVKGILLDKEMSNKPLPFANVFIKGMQIGTTTDIDGSYQIQTNPGTYTLILSFVGYQKVEVPNVIIESDKVTTIETVTLGSAEGMSLKEVIVRGSTSKETEKALLTEQKKAIEIKESIGAVRLAKIGVSNAAGATSKISGVTKNESSGDIFVRGLGDRYLSTTMNGLPIPSDDVENKNIDLNLFSTEIIQNVGVSKTYATANYADQASGTINITSKEFRKNRFSIRIGSGITSNLLKDKNWSNFKVTQNYKDLNFGVYSNQYQTEGAIINHSWNTEKKNTPLNLNYSFSVEKKFNLFNKKSSLLFTISHSNIFTYKNGVFKKYRSNVLDNYFNDTETYKTITNTTGLLSYSIKLNSNHKISFNSLLVNKTIDNLYEQGRNGEGYVFDQDPQEYGAFVRDQNLKQTRMFVNQLLGKHKFGEKNKFAWAIGYNCVNADEPNRIRNEANILNQNTIQFSHVGDFQQRKSKQEINDIEINGFIKDQLVLSKTKNKFFKLNLGVNFREKERAFNSLFIGVRAKNFQVTSIDNLSAAFVQNNFDAGLISLRTRLPDTYDASLEVLAAYSNLDFGFGKLSGNIGFRFEIDEINATWDVGNFVGREGSIKNYYRNILPNINLKYQLDEISFLRFATSKTITIPEFKELSPFEYVSPVGRITKGNPELKESTNYNIDLKWEMFPSSGSLFSFTGFYKSIQNPINLTQTRGSSGNFIYENTGEKATVFGLEFEAKVDLIKGSIYEKKRNLNLNLNVTKMWFNQDLLENFQYKDKTTSSLQGASNFILNTSLSITNNKVKEFVATLTANYSSDKILALGAPEDFTNSSTLYNDEIIEKGFVSLDLVLTKKLSENLSLKVSGKNLLNPIIQQTQKVNNLSNLEETNETVVSYKKGLLLGLSIKYIF